ncbi:Acetylocholine receptor beta subunit 29 [Aphelenchoides bicaudatus]|nr:Acetylocholine receptor beta subunit 29 [Aphelenchoides bicaudatus]
MSSTWLTFVLFCLLFAEGYNLLIQPVKHLNDTPLIVKMALQLVYLINVDEKDQIVHTNGRCLESCNYNVKTLFSFWLTLKWKDFQLNWNPVKYGGLSEFRVSPDKVWLPDIVLFNNAGKLFNGNYEVSFMSNVIINHKGEMLWVPPAIYKYNENEIKLDFEQAEAIDLSEYSKSSIWTVIDAPAALVKKRSRVEFQLRIRRKTLFYTVVLIIPTVLMAFLSMAVFFLPADSGEKMTLTISVLLSIVVFLLLVSKILPPTSSTIPLMAKYLLLTFVLNVITILVTVIILNVYHRGPNSHRMPRWCRIIFLKIMPHLMCMTRPKPGMQKLIKNPQVRAGLMSLPGVGEFTVAARINHPRFYAQPKQRTKSNEETAPAYQRRDLDPVTQDFYPLTTEAINALDAIEYITDHLRRKEEYKLHKDDWKYVSMIIDRLLLYVFFGVTVGGTIGILFSAPYVFNTVDQDAELSRLKQLYEAGGRE